MEESKPFKDIARRVKALTNPETPEEIAEAREFMERVREAEKRLNKGMGTLIGETHHIC